MKEIYIKNIAQRLDVQVWQVENCVELFEEGATIPFISRYRKERTGGLDEVAVAEIRHWNDVFTEMEKRKETVVETITQAGAMTPELSARIADCVESRELEDLYLPYKPKRRTRATVAKEAGLEPVGQLAYLRLKSVQKTTHVFSSVFQCVLLVMPKRAQNSAR